MANATPGRRRGEAPAPADPAPSVTWRSMEILGTFDAGHTHQTLSDISRRAGIPVATTHRLAGELLRWGALSKEKGRFVIGQRMWRIGTLAPVQQDIAVFRHLEVGH